MNVVYQESCGDLARGRRLGMERHFSKHQRGWLQRIGHNLKGPVKEEIDFGRRQLREGR